MTIQPLPAVTAANIKDPEVLANLTEINASIQTINDAISHAMILIRDFDAFLKNLNSPTIDKEWKDRNAEYQKLQSRLKDFTGKLKPAAQTKINRLYHNHEGVNGLNAQKVLTAAITTLSTRNRDVLYKLNVLVHDGKIQFPLPHTCPDGTLVRVQKFTVKNSGWILSGVLASVALLTLTPLGKILAPYAANLPEQLGKTCANVGQFTTGILNADPMKNALSSPDLQTVGYVAGGAALLYPIYSYTKEPVKRFARATLDGVDTVVSVFAKRPIITFLLAYGASYAIFNATGIDVKIGKHIQPVWVQGAIAGTTVFAVDQLKAAIAAYKKDRPAPPAKTPERLIPDVPPPPPAPRRPLPAPAVANAALQPPPDDDADADDAVVLPPPAPAPVLLPAPLPPAPVGVGLGGPDVVIPIRDHGFRAGADMGYR